MMRDIKWLMVYSIAFGAETAFVLTGILHKDPLSTYVIDVAIMLLMLYNVVSTYRHLRTRKYV